MDPGPFKVPGKTQEVCTDPRKPETLPWLEGGGQQKAQGGQAAGQQQPLRKAAATGQRRLLRREPEFEVKKEPGRLRLKISIGENKEKRRRFHQSSLSHAPYLHSPVPAR